jgi:ATP-dependent DNA helicase RecQ
VHTGFYRPNLELRVTACRDEERAKLLVDRLKSRPPGPTIVYVTLQKTASQIASYLAKCGFAARAYHAGMDADERTEIQDAFMASDEMIVVATIAFGMGIDKSNIRAVYHFNLPKGLESYMQEIGRAGRDGEPALCEMLACVDDVVTLENFSYGDTPDPEGVGAITDELLGLGAEFDVSIYDLAQRHDTRDLVVKTLITYLEMEGILQSTGSCYAEFRFQPKRPSAEILAQFDPARAEFLRRVLKCAKFGKTWFTLDADAASRQLKEPRERIVAALNYLEEKGDLIVEATGARQKYRRLKNPDDRHELVADLADRFLEREANDVARVENVVSMAEQEGCLWSYLLEYFGESHDACGHCGACAGDTADRLERPEPWTPTADDVATIRRLRGEKIAALTAPRQLARFLCGISSPAATRAKLRQRKEFGLWNHRRFADVLALAERR